VGPKERDKEAAKMMISWFPCLSLGRAIYNIQNKNNENQVHLSGHIILREQIITANENR
jgi:hypothetical protein